MSFDTIKKLNQDFERNYNNGQISEAVSSYANDGRLFADDKHIYEGLTQIEKYYVDAIADGNTNVNLHTGEVIQCSSDYLIEISTYKLNNNEGNYIVIWRKDNQQWKKLIDIFN